MARLTIGFQGEHGAYSEEAIYKEFGREVKTVPTASIREGFNLTEAGEVDLGVVPVENSVEGSINETYDMLVSSDLAVVGEVVLRVVHCLIALRAARLGRIKVVYSHPQALAQCRGFITSLGAEPIVTYDTAGSVKMIKEKRLEGAAAIAGARAACTGMRHLATAETESHLDLVSLVEELDQLVELDLVVALVGARPELDLLDLDLLLLELGFVRLLLLAVAELAVVHELADRRFGERRDLAQIDFLLLGHPHCFDDRHDSELIAVVRHQAHLRCCDLPVQTLRFLECDECISSTGGSLRSPL